MAKAKKPWRTIIFSEDTGRFTREQIRAAVRAVREENERKAASAARRKPAVSRSHGVAEEVVTPAEPVSKPSRAA